MTDTEIYVAAAHDRSPYDGDVRRLEKLAETLDAKFRLPGTTISVGVDSIIGLIPGIGDTISLGLSSLYIGQALRMKLPKRRIAKMGFNIGIDWLIGLVPVIGDLFDVGWKANIRNAIILREELGQRLN
jgi:hypothetical protein